MYKSMKLHLHTASSGHRPKQSLLFIPISPTICPPPSTTHPISLWLSLTIVFVYVMCIYFLENFFTFSHPVPLPLLSEMYQSIPCVHTSVSTLFVNLFVHWIPHIIEIIWYLSSCDRLISLSIIISRSIHAIAKGKVSFFYTAV